ncbi:MAG: glycosyltransferase family 4 protein [Candidatus Gottesmanbacteria bacterium]
MVKIGFYDPYLDSLGGGERYILTLAQDLSQNNLVDIFWGNQDIKDGVKKILGLNIDKTRLVENIFTRKKNLLEKLSITSKYDLIFFLSDGSIPSTLAKKNILHFQIPFNHLKTNTIINKIKLFRFNKIICNSLFTKKFIDITYGVDSLVIYPPVNTINYPELSKKNLILNVGRFTSYHECKKQQVMIDIFKTMVDQGLKKWDFYLAGGLLDADKPYFQKLKEQINGYPIKLFPNIPLTDLRSLYSQARIYWHANGFGEDEQVNPELFEHFGISAVEAMAAGAVPFLYDGGGHKEIINKECGFLWRNKEELIVQTNSVLYDDSILLKYSIEARKRAQDFSCETFLRRMNETIFN